MPNHQFYSIPANRVLAEQASGEGTVTVYKYVPAEYGRENIAYRRIKVTTLDEINDPFEFLSADLSDEHVRSALQNWKSDFFRTRGMLSFSRTWHNPVIWSHYAENHRGLCLRMEVAKSKLMPVEYSLRRLRELADRIKASRVKLPDLDMLLSVKYSHWRYEKEIRGFVYLEEKDPKGERYYFTPFRPELRLTGVFIGASSKITHAQLTKDLDDLADSVPIIKARLAFRSYRIVEHRGWTP